MSTNPVDDFLEGFKEQPFDGSAGAFVAPAVERRVRVPSVQTRCGSVDGDKRQTLNPAVASVSPNAADVKS